MDGTFSTLTKLQSSKNPESYTNQHYSDPTGQIFPLLLESLYEVLQVSQN